MRRVAFCSWPAWLRNGSVGPFLVLCQRCRVAPLLQGLFSVVGGVIHRCSRRLQSAPHFDSVAAVLPVDWCATVLRWCGLLLDRCSRRCLLALLNAGPAGGLSSAWALQGRLAKGHPVALHCHRWLAREARRGSSRSLCSVCDCPTSGLSAGLLLGRTQRSVPLFVLILACVGRLWREVCAQRVLSRIDNKRSQLWKLCRARIDSFAR
jgi:hypothetical protein